MIHVKQFKLKDDYDIHKLHETSSKQSKDG
jgi:hypothetical protein